MGAQRSAPGRDGDVWSGLTEEHYRSRRFDFFCNCRDLFTCSLNDFFMALTSDAFDTTFLSAIAAERNDSDVVAFISADEIEDRCRAIHCAISYKGGVVSLETVCEWQRLEAGLTVVTGAAASRDEAERAILGRISFNPPSIIVFLDPIDVRRQRFTLAHELGHLLLGHGAYMQAESVDEKDFESGDYTDLGADDVRRLEWQANCFASCLLLPRDSFVASVFEKARQMDLKDRGYGLIFLDHQRINTHNYYILTSALMDVYDASRTAVSIRLKSLGLLNDSGARRE